MRIAAIGDTHLGHLRFARVDAHGVNHRTSDIARTFERVVDQLIALRPDVILHGGDVFDNPIQRNATIMHAFRQLKRLRAALAETPIVIAAGNHDLPKVHSMGCILELFRELGIHVALRTAERFTFGDLSVFAVPEGIAPPPLVPEGSARYNVLLMHTEISGVIPGKRDGEGAIAPKVLNADRWDWIILGHIHVARQILPNATYTGSMEYTSTDCWGELREEAALGLPGKTLTVIDLATKARELHPIETARHFVDLEMDGAGMTPPDLNAAIAGMLDAVEGGIDDAVVRLVVHDCERGARREIDPKMMRLYVRRALNLQLDLRIPQAGIVIGGRSIARPMSMVRQLRDELASRAEWNGQGVEAVMEDLGIAAGDAESEQRAAEILVGLDDGYALKPDDEPLDTGIPTVPDYTAEYERIVASCCMPAIEGDHAA